MSRDDAIPHYLVRVIKEGVLLWGSDIYVEILRMRRGSHANGNEVRRSVREGRMYVCVHVFMHACVLCVQRSWDKRVKLS